MSVIPISLIELGKPTKDQQGVRHVCYFICQIINPAFVSSNFYSKPTPSSCSLCDFSSPCLLSCCHISSLFCYDNAYRLSVKSAGNRREGQRPLSSPLRTKSFQSVHGHIHDCSRSYYSCPSMSCYLVAEYGQRQKTAILFILLAGIMVTIASTLRLAYMGTSILP